MEFAAGAGGAAAGPSTAASPLWKHARNSSRSCASDRLWLMMTSWLTGPCFSSSVPAPSPSSSLPSARAEASPSLPALRSHISCTAWSTCGRASPVKKRTPFMRNTQASRSQSRSQIHVLNFSRSRRPRARRVQADALMRWRGRPSPGSAASLPQGSQTADAASARASWSCTPRARVVSKAPRSRILPRSMREWLHRCTGAVPLIVPKRRSTRARWSPSTRSVLLRRRQSA
mmetsp:Transcript_10222/g.34751  ORF Transcript_10222/g.34751 Transcript_10222/m.34751 type:complete len:231 (+) Transcript_10222:2-694(+)